MEPRLIRQPSLPLPSSLSPETGHEFRARLFERSPKRNESGELQERRETRGERERKPKTTDTKKEADTPSLSPLHGVCHFQFLILFTVIKILIRLCHLFF